MSMTQELPDDPRDKLHAVLNHDWPDLDDDLDEDYGQACAAWFVELSETDKAIAARVLEVYADGNIAKAAQIASQLPPAPTFPLP